MRNLFVAFALMSLSLPALAARPAIFEATSADKASGFRSMAECETALGRPTPSRSRATDRRTTLRGSVFNRRAGNLTRCEVFAGEVMMVVYPASQKSRGSR